MSGARDPEATIVITGIGLATALGRDRLTTWAGIRAGRSGARWLDRSGLEPESAGFPLAVGPWSDHPEPAVRLLETLANAAIVDAALPLDRLDRDRAGVLVGLSKGGLRSLARTQNLTRPAIQAPATGELAACWSSAWPSAGAASLARAYGWRGPCLAPIAACATGLVAAWQGAELIRRGTCDVVMVGSADTSLDPLVLGAFRRMRVLARVGEAPERATRPWDRDRTGFLVGEGGAILILERLAAALDRGIRPYAEVAGGALGADAFHETSLSGDPTGLARIITRALRAAAITPDEVAIVNVHGTATTSNDPLECRAIRQVFGMAADHLACSANKGQVGHLLGAAGAVELAITALSVRDGFVPPTLNLDYPAPGCDLDGTPHQGRSLAVPAALKLSLGFGGHLAALVLRRVDSGKTDPTLGLARD